jgi:hypothetical protein
VRKWGPMRVIEEVLKADQTRECSRVLFGCGHEATVMKKLTKQARCFLCRPEPPKRPARPGVFQSRPDHRLDRRRARPYHKHGLIALQNTMQQLGDRAIDARTSVGRALARWRSD